MKSTIDCIKYVVTEMDTDQSVTGRTISIDRLYTSIESANWLLYRGMAPKTERFLVQLVILKRRRRTFA